jgi:hypothetical protein
MNDKKEDWLQKARDGWSNRGSKRPPFAIEPYNETLATRFKNYL